MWYIMWHEDRNIEKKNRYMKNESAFLLEAILKSESILIFDSKTIIEFGEKLMWVDSGFHNWLWGNITDPNIL